jgi:DNA polymerase-3 subunit delta'
MNAAARADKSEADESFPEPRRNSLLAGQDAAAQALAEGFGTGRLAHAWLLTGPKGIGKATLAYRFARHVLAGGGAADEGPSLFGGLAPPTADDDPLYLLPEHPVFQRVAAGGHSDLVTLERTAGPSGKIRSEIVVDDVRDTIRFLKMTAGEGGWRVVIVDSADDLNPNAANALLKVLEEPPARALLILVSHNPGRLLATLRSRCRKLRLAELDDATLERLLSGYLPDLTADERPDLIRLADGSIGRALELARADGAELHAQIIGFLDAMPNPSISDLQGFGATMTRGDGAERFETFADLLRRSLAAVICRAGGSAPAPALANAQESEIFGRIAATGGLDRWLQVWDKTDELLRRTNHLSLDRKQVILNVFLTIAEAARG